MTAASRKPRARPASTGRFDEAPYLRLPSARGGERERSTTPAADGELPLGLMVRRVYLAISRGLNQALKERNVTPPQWVFLRRLWDEDGLNQKELAERVGIHPTTAVPALTILERSEYITRDRNGSDKRNVTVRLTTKGRKLAHELLPVAMEQNRRALVGMSEKDADKLLRLLHQVLLNLETHAVPEDIDA